MYFFYNIALILWLLLAGPFLMWSARRKRKPLPGLRQRLGALPVDVISDGTPTIWIHACSVGETLSVQALVQALNVRYPAARLVFSTVTGTGQAIARERYAKLGGRVFYLPVDIRELMRKCLAQVDPTVLVIVDTEIWPNLVREAHRRHVPVVLVNGRISARSFASYRHIAWFLGDVFAGYRLLLAASAVDAERLQRLGAPPSKIETIGNLKFDTTGSHERTAMVVKELDSLWNCSNDTAPLLVAGSTHPGEEQVILAALSRLRGKSELKNTRLLLAPRHPERATEAAAMASAAGFQVHRRSANAAPIVRPDVLLLDTVGELSAAYALATVVFVGGTLTSVGGHSILEPAAVAKPIVVGPHLENFPGIAKSFIEHEALIQTTTWEHDPAAQTDEIVTALLGLLCDPARSSAVGANAAALIAANRGATATAADRIGRIFEERLGRRPAQPI